jgi:hypothetical protein
VPAVQHQQSVQCSLVEDHLPHFKNSLCKALTHLIDSRLLNQLTIKDYDRRIDKFDFEQLVKTETASDVVKAVFSKVKSLALYWCQAKNNPMMTEFYVKIVIASIRKAYLGLSLDDQSEDFFALLQCYILEMFGLMELQERKLERQAEELLDDKTGNKK